MTVLETQRLRLRRMTSADLPDLCRMLQDDTVMWAYGGAFDDTMAQQWLDRQLARYQSDGGGYGLWAVLLRESGVLIGQCGVTLQDWNDRRVPEVGYLFCKEYWHHGYAIEAARACRDYAFEMLGVPAVYSIIREDNLPSRRVAERNGMTVVGDLIKHDRGLVMPHVVYGISNPAKT